MSMDGHLHIRIDNRTLTRFEKVCEKNNTTTSELVRSLMEAVIENRLRVTPRSKATVKGEIES